MIFDWIRMKGKTQEWVALQLGISQSTVSRIVQRYERWQAHAKDREGGRLDPAERLRAQRWLTFERNELMLASCLRIADEMESYRTAAKTTVQHGTPAMPEHTSRTQYEDIDRRSIAARFYRLAFRINMEQHKLAELDPPPPPAALSAGEIEEQELDAATSSEEIRAAHQKTIDDFNEANREAIEQQRQEDRLKAIEEAERVALAEQLLQGREPEAGGQESGVGGQESEIGGQESGIGRQESEDHQAAAAVNSVHKVHKQNGDNRAISSDARTSCDDSSRPKENSQAAGMNASKGRPMRQRARRNGNGESHAAHAAALRRRAR